MLHAVWFLRKLRKVSEHDSNKCVFSYNDSQILLHMDLNVISKKYFFGNIMTSCIWHVTSCFLLSNFDICYHCQDVFWVHSLELTKDLICCSIALFCLWVFDNSIQSDWTGHGNSTQSDWAGQCVAIMSVCQPVSMCSHLCSDHLMKTDQYLPCNPCHVMSCHVIACQGRSPKDRTSRIIDEDRECTLDSHANLSCKL